MERNGFSSLRVVISPASLIMLALMLLLLPIQWVLAVLIAALVHEAFHWLFLCALGGDVLEIRIGCRGVTMCSQPLSFTREGICALAGPVGSFLLLFAARWFPRVAICGVIHGLYNLLPLLPMDGGRVLRALIYHIFPPPRARRIFQRVHRFLWTLLSIVFMLAFAKTGIYALLLGIFLVRRILWENPLAKKPFWRYNRSTINNEVRL